MSTSEEDCSYLAILSDKALKEELTNLVYYTQRASSLLAIGGIDLRDVLLAYQSHKER